MGIKLLFLKKSNYYTILFFIRITILSFADARVDSRLIIKEAFHKKLECLPVHARLENFSVLVVASESRATNLNLNIYTPNGE
jgi:hypothetical protein